MLIAVDHGNKLTKVVNHAPFTSGLQESDNPPFGGETLKYRGKYYTLSEKRIPYHRDKTEDERFFVLTLFAIAYEIQAAKAYSPNIMRVQLAVGLPPAHYGAQHRKFAGYFTERGAVQFDFQGKPYSIFIEKVMCFPQAYAAAVTMLQALRDKPKALIIDQGGMTTDLLLMKDGAGDLSVCESLEHGERGAGRIAGGVGDRRHPPGPEGTRFVPGGRYGRASGPGLCQRPVQHLAGARAGAEIRRGGVPGRRVHPAAPADRGVGKGS